MTVNPDEVVAIGAALQAGVLKGEVEDVVLLDVTPLSLGLETLGGVMTKVIERNTTIPARRTETFSTAEDNQSAVDIVVLQGERELAADNRQLARFRLEGIQPAPRGVPQIEVTFDIDANGILNVSARDKQTGKEQRVTIQESTNLDPAEIERMVADAQAHAGEDRRRREEIDARNELDSLAYRVDQLVTELQDQLPVNDKARAEQLVADARQAIQEQAGLDRVRPLIADLQQLVHSLPASASATAGAASGGNGAGGNGAGAERAGRGGRGGRGCRVHTRVTQRGIRRPRPKLSRPTRPASSPRSSHGWRIATSARWRTSTTTASGPPARSSGAWRRPGSRRCAIGSTPSTASSGRCGWSPTVRAPRVCARFSSRWTSVLARQGAVRIGDAGERFDPERHEAIAVQASAELPDRTIVAVERSGFALGDRVVRPAQVVVARAPEHAR